MSLLEQLKRDQLDSRIKSETLKTNLLTALLGDALMVGKNDGNRTPTDVEITKVIKKFIKNIDEILQYKHDDNLVKEKDILNGYLPKQLSDDQLEEVISKIIDQLPPSIPEKARMGNVMKILKTEHDGTYDGKVASSITIKLLG